jgi:hypothetical protein
MFQKLWDDESGIILSAELVLVLTISVMGIIVGVEQVVIAVNEELKDFGNAIGAMNQTYGFSGFEGCHLNGLETSYTSGSGFIDGPDVCDNQADIVSTYVTVANSGG